MFHLHMQVGMPMKMEQSVPNRRHMKFRRRGSTQKKTFNFYFVRYMFRTRGFIFRKTVKRTGMVKYVYMPTVQAVLYVDCLYRWFVNKLYHTGTYNRHPENEPSGSKHVADEVKIKLLV
jgi:hypothetical protein